MPDGFDILIPVKPLARAKRRLAAVLGPAAREALVRDMLSRVLLAATGVGRARAIWLVTGDPDAAAIARRHGAGVLADPGGGLNQALEAAAAARSGPAVAIVQADLPWLTALALDSFLGLVDRDGVAAIAPDQHGRGTSALAWRGRPGMTRFAFGPDSLQRHVALARAADLTLVVGESSRAFHDVDDAADLREYEQSRLGSANLGSVNP